MITSKYDKEVGIRYHICNSLFLNLPFRNISRTGTLLPLLQQECEKGFAQGLSAKDIIERFFVDFAPQSSPEERFAMLFQFIQYVERQVALFDSIEDAAFEQINDLRGKGSISALLLRSKLEDKTEQLKARLENFSLRLVLTAHPTQFYPSHVLRILNDLENAIRENNFPQINLLLQQLGKTGFINQEKPSPYDEAVSLCWFLEHVFYKAIPEIIGTLAGGLNINLIEWKNPRLIRIGFWPGGDRDGNPFVTSEITLKVAHKLQETLLKCYYRDIRQLSRRLTFRGVEDIIIGIEQKIYDFVFGKKRTFRDANALIDELLEARQLLVNEHDSLFLEVLDMFILKVKLFGFSFASLDIRQDSRKHDAVWKTIFDTLHAKGELISWEQWQELPELERIKVLLELKTNLIALDLKDDFATETLKSIEAIGQIIVSNGADGAHRYIISNCQSATHVIEVFVLARLLIGKDSVPVDVVPLFETIDDLANAPAIMQTLYSIPQYRAHLQDRNDHQHIMLGFSDGTKDGGYLRANWSIFRAKENLTATSRAHDVIALFFDGRGGPPARGGGNTHNFYASLGDTIENQEVQITIQGQTISSNFGKVASCKYNLEQLLSAGLENTVFDKEETHLTDADKKLLDELAEEGYKAYLALKSDPQFVPYLERATPLAFFGDTNIGSRPVKRSGSSLKFEDLRAIPFVGSWAMMKQNIPGYYGVGTALQAFDQKGKGEQIKDLYQRSLFFRTLLGNSMMALTKSNFSATSYLAEDPDFGKIWKKMYEEYELSIAKTLEVSGLRGTMDNSPNTRDSVNLREKIVLPLVAIQQFALTHLRHDESHHEDEEKYRKLVIRCMFGIINAARNSA